MKEYKDCRYCGEPVVAPHDLDYHLSCAQVEIASKESEFDTKDISMSNPHSQDKLGGKENPEWLVELMGETGMTADEAEKSWAFSNPEPAKALIELRNAMINEVRGTLNKYPHDPIN